MKPVDWKKWAAIAEVFGTFAVVISLVFVGFSIRQNTAVIQADQQNVFYEMTDAWLSDMITNPDLYEIESRDSDPESLSYVERRRYGDQIYRAMSQWENVYLKRDSGLVSDFQYESIRASYENWIECCLPKWVWEDMKESFQPDFAATVDAVYDKFGK